MRFKLIDPPALHSLATPRILGTHAARVRWGRSYLEWVVVVLLLFVLVAVTLPSLQSMRELSRRSNCEQNLMRLGVGLGAFHTRFERYPVGTRNPTGPIESVPEGMHHNWISELLPSLEEQSLASRIDAEVSVYAPVHMPVRETRLPWLLCSSVTGVIPYTTCYAGIHAGQETSIDESNRGVLVLNRAIRQDDVVDGTEFTLILGEKVSPIEDDLGWMSGTRSTLRNTGHRINESLTLIDDPQLEQPTYVGGLSSHHPGGAYVLLCSGGYDFKSEQTDLELLQQLGTRDDSAADLPAASDSSSSDNSDANPQ